MTIKTLADLQPDSRNANRGTQRGRGLVETSLQKYGAGRSVLVDRNGVLIAGNKTTEAAADFSPRLWYGPNHPGLPVHRL